MSGVDTLRIVPTTRPSRICTICKIRHIILTRWAICLQNYDFTVKHVPGKLSVVPDTLSRIFSEVDGKPLSSEPQLAAICRNALDDQPFHSPNPREHELSDSNLDEIEPVESDRELFASADSVFPVVDAAKFLIIRINIFSSISIT